jgi:hypothetical protein
MRATRVAKGFKEKTSVMQTVSERRMKHNAEKLTEHLKPKDPARCKTAVQATLKGTVKFFGMMVSRAGLEPATTALKVRCSTN